MISTTFGPLPIGATFDLPGWGTLGQGETKISATQSRDAEGIVATVPPGEVVTNVQPAGTPRRVATPRLREVLPPLWVSLIAGNASCTQVGGPDLLAWAVNEPCSIDILATVADADALCEKWPEHADHVREIACERIAMLAWG